MSLLQTFHIRAYIADQHCYEAVPKLSLKQTPNINVAMCFENKQLQTALYKTKNLSQETKVPHTTHTDTSMSIYLYSLCTDTA